MNKTIVATNLEVEQMKIKSIIENCKSHNSEHGKVDSEEMEDEEIITQNQTKLKSRQHAEYLKLESKEEVYEKIIDEYNKKAFLELPNEKIVQDICKHEIGPHTDAFKDWYLASTMTFASINPLFKKSYIPKKKIGTK